MLRRSSPAFRIVVIPCTMQAGCFLWTISSADGREIERSRFAHASAYGARITGEIRAREIGIRI
ncbi:hypothetical protein [Methylobacterium amylolyticum]|uniref:hypothetical protein n=1 Tax=Methylobacterium sp. NEAU 140 TaxID=3064945 RepID=UPI0027337A9C|nr:hypothetical protein [Methylobacterium sp. NEAU 140]